MLMPLQSFALPTELNRDELRNFRTIYICQPRSHTSIANIWQFLLQSTSPSSIVLDSLRVDHSLCPAGCSTQQL